MADPEWEPTDAQIATLVALADDSLPRRRRAAAMRTLAGSPELASALCAQRRAVLYLRALDMPAPDRLRAHVEDEQRHRRSARRRGFVLGGALAGGLATAALLAGVVLEDPGSTAPSVAQAAELGERAPSIPAPSARDGMPRLLDASIAGLEFPNYRAKFGWAAAGMRTDELAGRATRTVFYERRGRRIAYTIVSGAPLRFPAGARGARRGGIDLRVFERGDATVVTWRRDDRTCVLSGQAARTDELVDLAVWKAQGDVRF